MFFKWFHGSLLTFLLLYKVIKLRYFIGNIYNSGFCIVTDWWKGCGRRLILVHINSECNIWRIIHSRLTTALPSAQGSNGGNCLVHSSVVHKHPILVNFIYRFRWWFVSLIQICITHLLTRTSSLNIKYFYLLLGSGSQKLDRR